MSDLVYLRRLKVETIIGINEIERTMPRQIVLDIECQIAARTAASEDHINSTVNYCTVATRAREFAAASNYRLLESLAENMAALLLRELPIQRVRIRAAKPGVLPTAAEAGIEIERSASRHSDTD